MERNGEGNREEVERISPTIQEDGAESDFETQGAIGEFVSQWESAISDNFGKYGDQSNLSEQRGADNDARALGNAELGGRCDVLMGDLIEVVADDFLGINEEPEKERHVEMVKFSDENERSQEEKKILTALALTEEVIGGGTAN